jgi:hypothetical protein
VNARTGARRSHGSWLGGIDALAWSNRFSRIETLSDHWEWYYPQVATPRGDEIRDTQDKRASA